MLARRFARVIEMRQHCDTGHKAGVGTYFVWVFYQDVFPFGHLQAQVGHSSHYAPTVRQGNVELTGEIHRAHGCCAQDDMPGVVPGVRPRNVSMDRCEDSLGVTNIASRNFLPDFHLFRSCQNALDGPFRQLTAVIFHLSSNDRAALRIQLRAPIGCPSGSGCTGIELIQRANGS